MWAYALGFNQRIVAAPCVCYGRERQGVVPQMIEVHSDRETNDQDNQKREAVGNNAAVPCQEYSRNCCTPCLILICAPLEYADISVSLETL